MIPSLGVIPCQAPTSYLAYGTWTQQNSSGNQWTSVAASSAATYVVAGANDNFLYTSSDSGVSRPQPLTLTLILIQPFPWSITHLLTPIRYARVGYLHYKPLFYS